MQYLNFHKIEPDDSGAGREYMLSPHKVSSNQPTKGPQYFVTRYEAKVRAAFWYPSGRSVHGIGPSGGTPSNIFYRIN